MKTTLEAALKSATAGLASSDLPTAQKDTAETAATLKKAMQLPDARPSPAGVRDLELGHEGSGIPVLVEPDDLPVAQGEHVRPRLGQRLARSTDTAGVGAEHDHVIAVRKERLRLHPLDLDEVAQLLEPPLDLLSPASNPRGRDVGRSRRPPLDAVVEQLQDTLDVLLPEQFVSAPHDLNVLVLCHDATPVM
jgi:hypothetical protein